MVLPTMFRATQNPDTPNLPFAQSLSPTMFRDNQNPNEPNLPFAQRPDPKDNTTCYEIFGTEMQLTEAAVQYYRNVGQTLKPCSSTPTPTGSGFTKSQVEKIIESYHGDDIKRLDRIHKEQEGRITAKSSGGFTKPQVENIIESYHGDDISRHDYQLVEMGTQMNTNWDEGQKQRDRIDDKSNANIKSIQNLWDRTDFAKEGHSHGGNGCDCEFWDIGCKAKCGIEGIIPYILIGGLAIYAVKTRKR